MRFIIILTALLLIQCDKKQEQLPQTNKQLSSYLWVKTAGGGLHLRNKPSVSGSKILLIPNGSRVEFLQQGKTTIISGKKGSWKKIRYNGQEGWSFGAYLTDEKIFTDNTNSLSTEKQSSLSGKEYVSDLEKKIQAITELEKTQPELAREKYQLIQQESEKALELVEKGKLNQEQAMQVDTIGYAACESYLNLKFCTNHPKPTQYKEKLSLLQSVAKAIEKKNVTGLLKSTPCLITTGCYACDGGYTALSKDIIKILMTEDSIPSDFIKLTDGSKAYAFGDIVMYLSNENGYWQITGFFNKGKITKIEDVQKNTCRASFL